MNTPDRYNQLPPDFGIMGDQVKNPTSILESLRQERRTVEEHIRSMRKTIDVSSLPNDLSNLILLNCSNYKRNFPTEKPKRATQSIAQDKSASADRKSPRLMRQTNDDRLSRRSSLSPSPRVGLDTPSKAEPVEDDAEAAADGVDLDNVSLWLRNMGFGHVIAPPDTTPNDEISSAIQKLRWTMSVNEGLRQRLRTTVDAHKRTLAAVGETLRPVPADVESRLILKKVLASNVQSTAGAIQSQLAGASINKWFSDEVTTAKSAASRISLLVTRAKTLTSAATVNENTNSSLTFPLLVRADTSFPPIEPMATGNAVADKLYRESAALVAKLEKQLKASAFPIPASKVSGRGRGGPKKNIQSEPIQPQISQPDLVSALPSRGIVVSEAEEMELRELLGDSAIDFLMNGADSLLGAYPSILHVTEETGPSGEDGALHRALVSLGSKERKRLAHMLRQHIGDLMRWKMNKEGQYRDKDGQLLSVVPPFLLPPPSIEYLNGLKQRKSTLVDKGMNTTETLIEGIKLYEPPTEELLAYLPVNLNPSLPATLLRREYTDLAPLINSIFVSNGMPIGPQEARQKKHCYAIASRGAPCFVLPFPNVEGLEDPYYLGERRALGGILNNIVNKLKSKKGDLELCGRPVRLAAMFDPAAASSGQESSRLFSSPTVADANGNSSTKYLGHSLVGISTEPDGSKLQMSTDGVVRGAVSVSATHVSVRLTGATGGGGGSPSGSPTSPTTSSSPTVTLRIPFEDLVEIVLGLSIGFIPTIAAASASARAQEDDRRASPHTDKLKERVRQLNKARKGADAMQLSTPQSNFHDFTAGNGFEGDYIQRTGLDPSAMVADGGDAPCDSIDGLVARQYRCVTIVFAPDSSQQRVHMANLLGRDPKFLSTTDLDLLYSRDHPGQLTTDTLPLRESYVSVVIDTKAEWNAIVTALMNSEITKRAIPIRFSAPLSIKDTAVEIGRAALRKYVRATRLAEELVNHPQATQQAKEAAAGAIAKHSATLKDADSTLKMLESLKPDELALCEQFHIQPTMYKTIKRVVLSKNCRPLKSVDSLTMNVDIDYFRLQQVLVFFETKGWVRLHTVYKVKKG